MDSENQYKGCQMCGREHRHSGEYDLPVCEDCRDTLLARPFPKWIKLFIIFILVVSAASLLKLPGVLAYSIDYEKGVKSSEAHKYVSAQLHFEKVSKIFPESTEVLAKLYESYYENGSYQEAYGILDKIIAADSEPEATFADRINAITDKMELYEIPSDAFYDLQVQVKDLDVKEQVEKIEAYVQENQSEIFPVYYLCDYYFEMERYTEIEGLLEPLLIQYPDWKLGLSTLIPVKRELGKYDEAKQHYETLIALNLEAPYSYITAAKVELKKKNDSKALEHAQKALELSPDDAYIQGVLAMVYYYLDDEAQTEHYLELFNAADDIDQSTHEFVNAIVSGQLEWR